MFNSKIQGNIQASWMKPLTVQAGGSSDASTVSFAAPTIDKFDFSPTSQARSANFSFNSQDPSVMACTSYSVDKLLPGPYPATERVKLNFPLSPREDGHYLYPDSDPKWVAANAFACVQRSVDLFWDAFGIKQWGFKGNQLQVNPYQGEGLDADYSDNEGCINFYSQIDPVTHQRVFSGASGESVTHEVGHALLHAMRPDYVKNDSPDAAGFRESFADQTAFLASLKDPQVVKRVAGQTHGNFSQSNIASELGEQLGTALNHYGAHVAGGNYLRNACNNLRWAEPASLPIQSEDAARLAREPHSYSQVWTGAFYDVFSGIVKENMADHQSVEQAISNAGEEGIRMLARLMQKAPQTGDFTYKQMAEAFLASDRELNHGQHSQLLEQVFTARKILPDPADGFLVAR